MTASKGGNFGKQPVFPLTTDNSWNTPRDNPHYRANQARLRVAAVQLPVTPDKPVSEVRRTQEKPLLVSFVADYDGPRSALRITEIHRAIVADSAQPRDSPPVQHPKVQTGYSKGLLNFLLLTATLARQFQVKILVTDKEIPVFACVSIRLAHRTRTLPTALHQPLYLKHV
jgi:hypothetical protein